MTKRNQSRANRCDRCGSSNWQSIELAYMQSARVSETGYETVSKFGQSIAPPEPRSTIAAPLFTAVGVGSGTLIFLPALLGDTLELTHAVSAIFDSRVYIPAALIGISAFIVHLLANLAYNAKDWSDNYGQWQRQRVCRSCGHQSSDSQDVSGTDSGSYR